MDNSVYKPEDHNFLYLWFLHTNTGIRLSMYGSAVIGLYSFAFLDRYSDWRWWLGATGLAFVIAHFIYRLFDLSVCIKVGLQQWLSK